MEKREILCTVGGNVKWCSHCGKDYGDSSKKLKIELPYDPAIPLLGIHPKDMESLSCSDIYTPMFTVALFTVAKTGSNLSAHLWMNR